MDDVVDREIVKLAQTNAIVAHAYQQYISSEITYRHMLLKIICSQDRAMAALRQQLLAQNSEQVRGPVVRLTSE